MGRGCIIFVYICSTSMLNCAVIHASNFAFHTRPLTRSRMAEVNKLNCRKSDGFMKRWLLSKGLVSTCTCCLAVSSIMACNCFDSITSCMDALLFAEVLLDWCVMELV